MVSIPTDRFASARIHVQSAPTALPRSSIRPQAGRPSLGDPRALGLVQAASTSGVALPTPTKVQQRSPEGALAAGLDSLARAQGANGLWNSPIILGTFHRSIELMALADANALPPMGELRPMIETLLAAADPKGGFHINGPTSPKSRAASRLAVAALEAVANSGRLSDDGPLPARMNDAATAARAFIDSDEPSREDPIYTLQSGFLLDSLAPDTYDLVNNWPFFTQLWEGVHGTGVVGGALEMPLAEVMAPTFTALVGYQARVQSRVAGWTHRFGGEAAEKRLVQQLLENQDKEGSWLYSVSVTGMNLMALKRLGVPNDHPAIQSALEYMASTRELRADGTLRHDMMISDVWDTSHALSVLHHAGHDMPKEAETRALRALLDAQRPDGLWSFSAGGLVPDTDDSGVALKALAERLPHVTDEEFRAEIIRSIRFGTRILLDHQQDDGGYGAFGDDAHWGAGRKAPSAMSQAVFDPSTPGLSARVFLALHTVRASGLLDAKTSADLDQALTNGVSYLRDARHENGAWWNRWFSGFVAGFDSIPAALRLGGVSTGDPLLADSRAFLLAHQNADGGFGEVNEADNDPSLAGKGPSTPGQTGNAMLGLIASARDNDPAVDAALDRAAAYLARTMTKDGGWDNGRPLNTWWAGLEYYDAPQWTQSYALHALAAYRDYKQYGPEYATRALAGLPTE